MWLILRSQNSNNSSFICFVFGYGPDSLSSKGKSGCMNIIKAMVAQELIGFLA
jgi:hypothetical protein